MAGTTIVFTLLIQFIVDLKRFVLDQPVAPRIETDILTLILAITLLQIFSNSAIMLNAPLWSLSAEWIITLAGGGGLDLVDTPLLFCSVLEFF